MTERENERLDKIDTRLGNLEKAVEKLIVNDIPHLEKKLTLLLKIFSFGFTVVAVMITILGVVMGLK